MTPTTDPATAVGIGAFVVQVPLPAEMEKSGWWSPATFCGVVGTRSQLIIRNAAGRRNSVVRQHRDGEFMATSTRVGRTPAPAARRWGQAARRQRKAQGAP